MTRERLNAALVCLLVALLAGCGTSPKARFYTLSSAAPPAAEASATGASAYSVNIGPVTVPDMVDRPQLVVRAGANRLLISEDNRWGEPLRNEIPKVIAQDLAGLLATYRVSAYPQRADEDADYRVIVDIQRFDSTLGGNATIEALWSVTKRSAPPPLKGHTLATQPATGGDSYDALVAAQRRALSAVSRDIAAAIRSIGTAQAGK